MVRVLIVDDHVAWRRFVALTLRVRQEVEIVGEAENGLTGIQKAGELRPDVVVLDIGLADVNGIEVARRILELSPKTKVLFFSQYTSRDIVLQALGVGAYGYVTKFKASQDLLPALEALMLGNIFVSPNVDPRVCNGSECHA